MTDNTKTQGVVIHVHHLPKSTLERMSLGFDLGFGFAGGVSVLVLLSSLLWRVGKALFA